MVTVPTFIVHILYVRCVFPSLRNGHLWAPLNSAISFTCAWMCSNEVQVTSIVYLFLKPNGLSDYRTYPVIVIQVAIKWSREFEIQTIYYKENASKSWPALLGFKGALGVRVFIQATCSTGTTHESVALEKKVWKNLKWPS